MRKFTFLISLVGLAATASADAVYDNSTNFLGFRLGAGEIEWGDGATLAGTDRLVTGISYMIHNSSPTVDADVIGRLYAGGDSGAEPGALLWESAPIRMTILGSSKLYDLAVPNVVVPDEVTWTVQLLNRSNQNAVAGSRFMNPPTIGSSEDNVWDHANGVWTRHIFGIGAPNNFGAIITAVPEPASLVLFGLGGLALVRRRR